MKKLYRSGHFTVSIVGSCLALAAGSGCANERAVAPPVVAPAVMLAPPPPTVQPTASVADSSSLAVSDEIAMACKLNFDDVDNAPKFDFDESALSAQDDSTLSRNCQVRDDRPAGGPRARSRRARRFERIGSVQHRAWRTACGHGSRLPVDARSQRRQAHRALAGKARRHRNGRDWVEAGPSRRRLASVRDNDLAAARLGSSAASRGCDRLTGLRPRMEKKSA